MSNRPLHELRKWVMGGHVSDIQETDTTISYDGVTLELDKPTEYKTTKNEIYTVRQIWFLLCNKDITYTDYIATCKKKGLSNVKFTDKKNIIEWLEGTKTTIDGIVEMPEETHEAEESKSTSAQLPAQTKNETDISSSIQASTTDNSAQIVQPKQEEKMPQPAEIEIKLDSTSERTEAHPVIEYEKIRTIDSMLLCTYDFSEMLHKNDVIKKHDSIIQQNKYNNDNQGLNGYNGDSIINIMPQKSQFQNYIILVSRASSGLINNSNIEEFLTNSRWVQPTQKPERKHFVISHNHSEKMRQLKYDIVADEQMLSDSDWNKVVAIFVIGKGWQIKHYKPNEPQTLFQKILGIYVGWDQEQMPLDIRTWRIKFFTISKASRHSDPQAVNNIWHEIEEATEHLKKKRND